MARCKGCGKEIEYVKSEETGNLVPLQYVSSYEMVTIIEGGVIRMVARRADKAWISHFLTCPKADRFSGRARGDKDAGEKLPD